VFDLESKSLRLVISEPETLTGRMTAKFSCHFWHETRPIIVLFHPDYTVGPGIKPGLLTLSLMARTPIAKVCNFCGVRGLSKSRSRADSFRQTPPVGNYTPP
jgi:hypothetical protein